MKSRVIVEISTGVILSTGVCLEEDFNNVPTGCAAYENTEGWSDSTHKFLNGEFVELVQTPEEAATEMWLFIRTARDGRLAQCDWTQVSDSPLTAEQRSEWQMYRQRLRDLPSDYSHVTSLEDVVWPNEPS